MLKIENETDLRCKVVDYNSRFYPEAIIVAGLGELQHTCYKRISSWKKGYVKGHPDLMIMSSHKNYNGCCIEFKSPTNNYQVSQTQKEMRHRYRENGYYFLPSNDYDLITNNIHEYMKGIRVPCKSCEKSFLSKETRKTHYKIIHRVEK